MAKLSKKGSAIKIIKLTKHEIDDLIERLQKGETITDAKHGKL